MHQKMTDSIISSSWYIGPTARSIKPDSYMVEITEKITFVLIILLIQVSQLVAGMRASHTNNP